MSKNWVPGFRALPFATLVEIFLLLLQCLQGRREATLNTGTLQFLFHPGLQSVSKHLLCEYISSLWKLQLCRELHWSGASQGIAVSQNTKSCSPGRAASGSDWICKGLKSFTAVLSNTNICMFFVWNKRRSGKMFHMAHWKSSLCSLGASSLASTPRAVWERSELWSCAHLPGTQPGHPPSYLTEASQTSFQLGEKHFFSLPQHHWGLKLLQPLWSDGIPITELGCHRNLQADFWFSRAQNFGKKIWLIAFSPLKRKGVGFFLPFTCVEKHFDMKIQT